LKTRQAAAILDSRLELRKGRNRENKAAFSDFSDEDGGFQLSQPIKGPAKSIETRAISKEQHRHATRVNKFYVAYILCMR